MNLKRLTWKIFSIQKDEYTFVFPLFLLYLFSGSFFAVGQIYSETLFLKAYGAEGFSRFFVLNGIAIIFTGVFYNYYLLKFSLKKGYIFLITAITLLIISSSLLQEYDFQWLPFYVYMGNYLFTVFLDIHFFNYAFQHLTIRNSKRILPFLMGGGKLGGIIASILIFSIFSKDISRFGILVWAINGALLLIPILFFKITEFSGDEKAKVKKNALLPNINFFDKLVRNVKFSVSTPSFIYSILIAFVMSIVNQISEYYFAKIFTESFATGNELSSFLSLYTLIADFITLIIQLFIISRVIQFIGVRKANLVYPLSFFSLISICVVFPNLIVGIMLRFFRKNISNIIRTPIFNIIMAASPRDRMTEVKSFISGIINPLGMIAGGGAILLIYKKLTPIEGYIFAISLGLLYIILCHFQNKTYVQSLKNMISFNSHAREGEESIAVSQYAELLRNESQAENNIEIVEALFNNQPSIELLPSLSTFYKKLSFETKENILNLLKDGRSESAFSIISKSAQDNNPQVRSIALSLLSGRSYNFKTMVLKNRYSNILEGEKSALSILLAKDGKIEETFSDDYMISKIIEIKKQTLENKKKPIEFIMLTQVLPYLYFLNHLYELAITNRDVQFLKCLIPFADKLTKKQVKKIIYIFKDHKLDYLSAFLLLSKNIQEIDKLMLLDYRDLSYEYIKKLFVYDEKSLNIIIGRLFKNRSYYKKSNYLKLILSLNKIPEEEIEKFINFQIEKIRETYELKNYFDNIDFVKDDYKDNSIKFINILLNDIIDLQKHLILKAISILTGSQIDVVYYSNILLKDKDLDNFILEYIESSIKHKKEVISIFEEKFSSTRKSSAPNIEKSLKMKLNYLIHFLPEISNIIKFSFISVLEKIDAYNTNTLKISQHSYENNSEADMLSLIEKIIFLKENKLFSELKINEIIHIANIAREIEVPSNEIIIKQGEKGSRLFILIDGEVKVYTHDRNLATLGPGNCIGELSIIDEEPRSANVMTVKKTRILSINRKDFLLTLSENPAISINIMQVIAGRLRDLI